MIKVNLRVSRRRYFVKKNIDPYRQVLDLRENLFQDYRILNFMNSVKLLINPR